MESESQMLPPTWVPGPAEGGGGCRCYRSPRHLSSDTFTNPNLLCSGVRAFANDGQMDCFRTMAHPGARSAKAKRALLCCRIYCYLMNWGPLLFKVGDTANCPSCTLWPPCTEISWSPTTIPSLFLPNLPMQVLYVTARSVLVQKGQSPYIVSNLARAPDCLSVTVQALWTLVFLLAMLLSGPWSCSSTAFVGQNTHFLNLASPFSPALLFSV